MLKSRLPQIALTIDLIVDEAIKEGAETVANEARSRVPVQTGKLRDAIHVEPEHDGTYVVAGDEDVWYGHLVEHGTAKTPARPFLVPALEGNRGDIVGHVKDRLRVL